MDISVIIPAYNEGKTIGATLGKVFSYFDAGDMSFEIITVDDGSRDNTFDEASAFGRRHKEAKVLRQEENRGKGAAVRAGMMASVGSLVMFTDSDLSAPIEDFPKLCRGIEEGYDISIGSRRAEGARIIVKQPLCRRIAGSVFPLLVRMLVLKEFRDTQCGFKLFRGDVGRLLFSRLKTEGFAFDVEILYRAKLLDYRVKEVPVDWRNSDSSRVNILKDPPGMLKDIVLIKKRVGRDDEAF